MNKLNVQAISLVVLATITCLIMFWIENTIQPDYIIKSIIKIILFGGSVLMYSMVFKDNIFQDGFGKIKK